MSESRTFWHSLIGFEERWANGDDGGVISRDIGANYTDKAGFLRLIEDGNVSEYRVSAEYSVSKEDFKLLGISSHTGNWHGTLQLAQIAHEVAAENIWVRQVACK